MRVVIAGGSGFLGRALSALLLGEGHEVIVLTRSYGSGGQAGVGRRSGFAGDANQEVRGAPVAQVQWTPDGHAGSWAEAVDGAHVVVNLAGESIASRRWTAARKTALVESRLLATRSLVGAVAAARRPPAVLISVSGQNYYGERGDDPLSESEPPGNDFLAGLCVQWEAEARKVEGRTRVVLLRTGIVLSEHEGALPQMLKPFRMFAGGPVGSGRQFVSWVHWRDWVEMARWVAENDAVSGPVNVSAPDAVRNRQLASAIGRVLNRPSAVPAPAFALRLALGEMADALLLTSIRMVPAQALKLGYRFRFTDVEEALTDLLRP